MILLERDDEAKRAIGKLIDAGAMGVKNNENFLLIKEKVQFLLFQGWIEHTLNLKKAHLEALDVFFEWTQLEQARPNQSEKPDIDATRSFMKVCYSFALCLKFPKK